MRFICHTLLLCLLPTFLISQHPQPPVDENLYSKVTSYEELSEYVRLLDKSSDLLDVSIIGQSVQGRNLYALKFSSSKFGKDKSRIRVMIFAQQHGNEQSGKEGALMLACELTKPENLYLFEKIDFLLIPQVNPDGAEINERRNANDMDLNRNHVILTEPETQAIHEVFDRYLFEVTMDVHEYSPYGEDWLKYGYRKNSDVTLGTMTNPNVSIALRNLSNEYYLPFFLNYLREKGFSAFEYCPGGPPDSNYIRHSTFDINDGRQSLGIQHTFSFIQEGMNGEDSFIENLRHRTESQYHGMRCLLEFVYREKDRIKDMVSEERQKLASVSSNQALAIQCEHTGDGTKLELPLYSYHTGKDTILTVLDYRPVVTSTCNINKPLGYLVPKQLSELTDWAGRHSFITAAYRHSPENIIEQYYIEGIDTLDFEGDPTVNPRVTVKELPNDIRADRYIFIPAEQLKGNLLILALEVKSIHGLVTYRNYAHLLKERELYPVLRVVKKQE